MNIREIFVNIYGDAPNEPARCFHAPGRVNIIGEHIDYNGGNVLPCGLDLGTYALIRRRRGNVARFASTNFGTTAHIPLDNVVYDAARGWANYPAGIVRQMQQAGRPPGGFDVLFSGDIPIGTGLSSSASIELVMAVALNSLFSLGYSMLELVKLAQKSENEFCGVNCGIMDQFASGMSKKDNAILLNCTTLDFSYVPLALGSLRLVVLDTKKSRSLAGSKYNERRRECGEAFAILSRAGGIPNLASLGIEDFLANEGLIKDEIIKKRAKHVIYENHRVALAVRALAAHDFAELGRLMHQSHVSLAEDYEVSCPELDTIVHQSLKTNGCIGARMTGAGFGGCAIALVEENCLEDFIHSLDAAYTKAIGRAPGIYTPKSGDGAREVTQQILQFKGGDMSTDAKAGFVLLQ